MRQLRAMTRDNPDQQILIGALESSVNGRIALMNQALAAAAARRCRRRPAIAARCRRPVPISDQIAAIVQNEDSLLEQRQAAAQQQAVQRAHRAHASLRWRSCCCWPSSC